MHKYEIDLGTFVAFADDEDDAFRQLREECYAVCKDWKHAPITDLGSACHACEQATEELCDECQECDECCECEKEKQE